MTKFIFLLSLVILSGCTQNKLQTDSSKLYLSLETRDPITNQVITKIEEVDNSKIGIIIEEPYQVLD